MPKEIETKFKIKSKSEIKKKLKKIGAKVISKKLEKDIYYKIPLSKHDITVIRLRSLGKDGIFTIKLKLSKSGA